MVFETSSPQVALDAFAVGHTYPVLISAPRRREPGQWIVSQTMHGLPANDERLTLQYFDAHVHVGLMANATEVAGDCVTNGIGLFSCGVNPRDWLHDCKIFEEVENVRIGAGLHPWWIAKGACGIADAELLADLCWKTRWIGEVGLDFLPKHASGETWELQRECFALVCRAAAEASRASGEARVLSIHSVKAAGAVLDVLEETGALEACRCVFHWFSGSTDELWRAIHAGCWFSVNEMGLKTGKGREYTKLIPAKRLLTETDQPAELGGVWSAEHIEASLSHAVELLAAARGSEPEEIRELAVANAEALFA